MGIDVLDSTHFVMTYNNGGGDDYAVVGSIASGVITFGTPLDLGAGYGSDVLVAALSSSAFVTLSQNSSASYISRYCTVSGTTVTNVTNNTPYSGGGAGATPAVGAILALSSSSWVVVSFNGYATIYSYSGGSISGGTSAGPISTNTPPVVAKVSSSSFVVAWINSSKVLNTNVCTFSGSTITTGTSTNNTNAITQISGQFRPQVVMTSATNFYWVALQGSTANQIVSVNGTIASGVVTTSANVNTTISGISNNVIGAYLFGSNAVISYTDNTNVYLSMVTFSSVWTKALSDSAAITDTLSKSGTKALTQTLTISDIFQRATTKLFAQTATLTDALMKTSGHIISELSKMFTGWGDALTFNGSSQYVTASDANLPLGNSPRTLSGWFNLSSIPGAQGVIVAYGNESKDNANALSIGNTPNLIFFGWADDFGYNFTPTVGAWYHAVGTFDGTTATMYLNGASVATASKPSWNTTSNVLRIGNDVGGYGWYFPGSLDEIRIWNRCLSATEVANLYSENAVPRNGLVSEWLFNEGTGSTAYDTSGNGNNGTLVNSPTWVTSTIPTLTSPYWNGFQSAKVKVQTFLESIKMFAGWGNALSFNGTNQYATVGNMGSVPSGTISYWVSFVGSSGSHPNPLTTDNGSVNAAFRFEEDTNAFYSYDGSNIGYYFNGSLPTGVWQHIVLTWNASTVQQIQYLNGVQVNSIGSLGTYSGNIANLTFGVGFAARYFPGSMDEVRIWNRPLSATEISNLYNQNTVPTNGLIGEWLFNEGTGSTAYDTSGMGFNATLTNSPTWVTSTIPPLANAYQTGMLRSVVKAVADSVALADTFIRTTSRFLFDSTTLSDAFGKLQSRLLSELTTLTDYFSTLRVKLQSLAETIVVTDRFTRFLNRIYVESTALSDLLSRFILRAFVEATFISDATSRIFNRVFNQAITIADSISIGRLLVRAFSELTVISDLFRRVGAYSRTFYESSVFSDIIKKVLDGSSTIWTKRVKPALPTWLTRTKPTSTWTPRIKP